jgi:glycosyltransferase involved in cell wall biosynthesis
MTIDIIIPTYNRKNYLKKAIDSVLKQSYKDINIIISDNDSDDLTEELVNEYLSKYDNIYYYKQDINI